MQAWNESEEQKSKCRSQHDWKGNLSLGPHFPAAHLVYFLIRVIAIPQIFALLSDQHCSQSTNFSEHKKQLEVSRSPNTKLYSPNKLALPLQCLSLNIPTVTGLLHRQYAALYITLETQKKQRGRSQDPEKKSTSQSRVRRMTALEIIKHYSRFCFELTIKLRSDRLRLTAVHASICNFFDALELRATAFLLHTKQAQYLGSFCSLRLALRRDSKWNGPFTNVQEKKISNAYWAPNAEVQPDLGTETSS